MCCLRLKSIIFATANMIVKVSFLEKKAFDFLKNVNNIQ